MNRINDEDIYSLISSSDVIDEDFLKALGEIIYPVIAFDKISLEIFPMLDDVAASVTEYNLLSKEFLKDDSYAPYESEELLVAEPEEEYIPEKKKKPKKEERVEKEFLKVPLKFKGEVIGAINLFAGKTIFTDEEKQCIEKIATPLSFFIENNRLTEKLRETQKSFEKIVKKTKIGMIFFSKDGRCNNCNRIARELFKKSDERCLIEEFMETGDRSILPERFLDGLKKALKGEMNIVESIKLEFEDEKKTKGKWIACTFLPVTDDNNQVIKVICILEDITDKALLEQRLKEAEKLASTGQLAAGIAHEINNPLSGIKNAFYILAKEIPYNHPKRPLIDLIDKEINRISKIIMQLLDFYKVKKDVYEKVDVEKIIDELRLLVSGKLKSASIEFIMDIKEDTKYIVTSIDKIKQVFLSIIVNAIESMPNGGKLAVSVRKKGDGIIIEFIDTGCGMPADSIKDIFNPFFTTKTDRSKYTSIGLGLSVAKTLMDSIGGDISVTSKVGKGTNFTIFIPKKKM